MGFEDFHVLVRPEKSSRLYSDCDIATLNCLADELKAQWSDIRDDAFALKHLSYPVRDDEAFLVYEASDGLIEIQIKLQPRLDNSVVFSLRFACCNPRSVYEPFCGMIQWLIKRHRMHCVSMRDDSKNDAPREITNPADVRTALLPGMEASRSMWFTYADSQEDEILRPGEAIERFIAPRFLQMQIA